MNPSRTLSCLLASVLLISAGCDSKDSSKVKASMVRNAGGYDYVAAGMPSPDRPWRPSDYPVACRILKGLANNNGALLPRYQGPGTSGVMFARMVSPENYSLLNDRSVPLNTRVPLAVGLLEGQKLLMVPYFGATRPDAGSVGHPFGDELL